MAEDKTDDSESAISARRDRYRDNDDERDPLAGDEHSGVRPDSKGEARGSAREQVGDNTRGTAAFPTGPEDNDRTRRRPRKDGFDEDLRRDD
jgi:hypothetical protein